MIYYQIREPPNYLLPRKTQTNQIRVEIYSITRDD